MNKLFTAFTLCAVSFLFVACDDGPIEEAGEGLDEAAENVGDAVEDVADDVEDAVDGD